MSDHPWHPNPPPHGLSRDQIEQWALKYAPRLRFHRNERHFPSDPESFRLHARFRESLQGERDMGWDTQDRDWVRSNDRAERFFGARPDDLQDQTGIRMGAEVTIDPGFRRTLRPHDGRNMYRPREGKRGFFMERDDGIDRRSSGHQPRSGVVSAPLILDATEVDLSDAGPFVKVLFWFFYELNYFLGFLTHEGDWEHVSYFVSVDDLVSGDPPAWVYFAQHNGGEPRAFGDLEMVDQEHPIMYVDRHGHPTRASVSNPDDYDSRWDTWTVAGNQLRWLRDEPWKEFSGAWGEVGETKHTTGPLGPWFKQGGDLVRVRRRNGRIEVSIPKS